MKFKILFFIVLTIAILEGVWIYFIEKPKNEEVKTPLNQPQQLQSSINQTEIIKYQQTFIPKESKPGSCWTESIAASPTNSKAWRCMSNNNVFDPCFETDNNKIVCNVYPDSDEQAFELRLTKPLPEVYNRDTHNYQLPWWVKLSNGYTCAKWSGTAGNIDNEVFYYGCGNNIVLLGDSPFDTTNPLWTAKVGYLSRENTIILKTEIIDVVKAWE